MSESDAEKLSRVTLMASGSSTWNLSLKDLQALEYVLAENARLRAALEEIRTLLSARQHSDSFDGWAYAVANRALEGKP